MASRELLHEVDSEGGEDGEEEDAHGVVEVIEAVDLLLHQDGRPLQLFVLLLVCLVMHLVLSLEFLQLDVVDLLEKDVAHQVRHWEGGHEGDHSHPDKDGGGGVEALVVVEGGGDDALPEEVEENERGPGGAGEPLLVAEPEDGVETPAGPLVVPEAALVDFRSDFAGEQDKQPEEEGREQEGPQRHALPHVRLELSSITILQSRCQIEPPSTAHPLKLQNPQKIHYHRRYCSQKLPTYEKIYNGSWR